MKLILNLLVLISLSLSAQEVLATGKMISVPFSDSDNAFVTYPAAIGFGAGAIVGVVVSVPVVIVTSANALVTGDQVSDTAEVSFWVTVFAGGSIGGVIIGAPFWAVKQVFYDLPKKFFEEGEQESELK